MMKVIPAAASARSNFVDGWQRHFRPLHPPGDIMRTDEERIIGLFIRPDTHFGSKPDWLSGRRRVRCPVRLDFSFEIYYFYNHFFKETTAKINAIKDIE